MAFGFSSQYAQDDQLEGLDREHFLAIAIEAIDRLELKLSKVSSSGILVYTKMSAYSWAEEITLTFGIDKVTVRSQCAGNQLFDWGKNKRNVQNLILEFKHVRRNQILERYCQGRIKSFELIQKALLYPDEDYNYELNYYKQYIMSQLEQMQAMNLK